MISVQTSLLIAVSSIAAFSAVAVGGAVMATPRRRGAGVAAGVAGLAALAGAAALQVGWEHAGALPSTRLVRSVDAVLAVLSGSVLLDVVWRCIRGRPAPRAIYLPAPVLAAVAVFAPPAIAARVSMPELLPVQAAFTVAAVLIWRAGRDRAPPARARIAAAVIAAIAVVHAAQLARTFGGSWSRDAVPIAIAALLALALAAVLHPRGRRLFADGRAEPDPDLFARFAAWLNEPAAFRDPDLRLGDAATRLGVRPEALSAAVNGGAGVSFSTFVARRRVEEAKRLFEDPGERRTSVEAIGLLAGFKSRSAFHDAFKTHVGVTPSRFRAESGPGS